MSRRQTFAGVLGLALALGISSGAAAQNAVLQAVAVQVQPGQLDTYLERIKSLQGVMQRVGSAGTLRAWRATLAGPASGTVFVAIAYPSLSAFAESTSKVQGDAEWRKLIAGLDAIRTIQSSSLYRSVSGEDAAVTANSVLQTVTVRVKPGQLDDYVERVDALQKVSDRLGVTSSMRIWQATLAGDATGTVVVGLIHPSLAAYADNTTKMQGDAEWQKRIAGLDDIRSIVSTGLARSIGP